MFASGQNLILTIYKQPLCNPILSHFTNKTFRDFSPNEIVVLNKPKTSFRTPFNEWRVDLVLYTFIQIRFAIRKTSSSLKRLCGPISESKRVYLLNNIYFCVGLISIEWESKRRDWLNTVEQNEKWGGNWLYRNLCVRGIRVKGEIISLSFIVKIKWT